MSFFWALTTCARKCFKPCDLSMNKRDMALPSYTYILLGETEPMDPHCPLRKPLAHVAI